MNNAIVRVPTSALQSTNVDVGAGSGVQSRMVAFRVKKKGAKRIFVGTVSAASPSCVAGKVQVRRAKGKKSVLVAKGKAKVSGGFKVTVAKSRLPKQVLRARQGQGRLRRGGLTDPQGALTPSGPT